MAGLRQGTLEVEVLATLPRPPQGQRVHGCGEVDREHPATMTT
jgi:hypothetical protein